MANEKEPYPFLEVPEFDINQLDAVIVSHAHLDHSGFVPWLFKMGYQGPVYCTSPTRDVMALLQLDYIKIQKNDIPNESFHESKNGLLFSATVTVNLSVAKGLIR